jgi:hypothetical protein
MGSVLEYIQAVVPALITFGPVFLVMGGKDARRTQLLRYLGAIMVCGALMTLWFATNRQKRQIELMHQQIERLDARIAERVGVGNGM